MLTASVNHQSHTTYSRLGPIPDKRPRLKPQLITGLTLGCRVPAPERIQHPGYAYENPLNGIFSFRPMRPLPCLASPCRVFPCLAPRRAVPFQILARVSPPRAVYSLRLTTSHCFSGCNTSRLRSTKHAYNQETHGYDNRCLPTNWGKRWHFPLLHSQLSSEVERKQTTSHRIDAARTAATRALAR